MGGASSSFRCLDSSRRDATTLSFNLPRLKAAARCRRHHPLPARAGDSDTAGDSCTLRDAAVRTVHRSRTDSSLHCRGSTERYLHRRPRADPPCKPPVSTGAAPLSPSPWSPRRRT
ncbi:putative NHS-like protein 1 [Sesbania bispinosa]|nr:putative NHS-like protein 1 [Sesbania bispinosa]